MQYNCPGSSRLEREMLKPERSFVGSDVRPSLWRVWGRHVLNLLKDGCDIFEAFGAPKVP